MDDDNEEQSDRNTGFDSTADVSHQDANNDHFRPRNVFMCFSVDPADVSFSKSLLPGRIAMDPDVRIVDEESLLASYDENTELGSSSK